MIVMTDCIKWDKYIRKSGYGVKIQNYKRLAAHRWAWEQVNGPIPEGFVIDHTCHNEAVQDGKCKGGVTCPHRACVNVEHLELVTQSENVRRGAHAIEARQTCPKGHSYSDPNNIMLRKDGRRECAQCNRERASANYYKSKAA